jgi:hypothetical protein
MCFAVGAIVINLQEEGALVTPHILKHVGYKVASDGDKVTLARWFTALDAVVHSLVLGHALAQVQGHIDGGIAAIGWALLGDPLGLEQGSSARDVLAGGGAEEAGHVRAAGVAMNVTHLADQSQCVADTGTSGYYTRGEKNMWKWTKFIVFSSPENDKVWRVSRSEFASAPNEYIARARADGFQLWEYEQVYVGPEPWERPSEH